MWTFHFFVTPFYFFVDLIFFVTAFGCVIIASCGLTLYLIFDFTRSPKILCFA